MRAMNTNTAYVSGPVWGRKPVATVELAAYITQDYYFDSSTILVNSPA
jgi:hypothetical protein